MKASQRLEELLQDSGAVAYGWTVAACVPEEEWAFFEDWIDKGFHAGMGYMENYPEIRKDPRLLLPGAKTIISVAYNYRQSNPYRGVATYALGQDYHKVLRKRLKKVTLSMKKEFGGDWRVCVDSAPILERYWAQKCGVGSRSPVHGNIIVPGVGSMVFLAEILSTLEIEPLGVTPQYSQTGCPEEISPACPTGALQPGGTVDARRCINYLTIEHKGELDGRQKQLVGDAFFGCDICQRGCPCNSGPNPPVIPEFHPLPGLESFIKTGKGFDLSKSPMARAFRSKGN